MDLAGFVYFRNQRSGAYTKSPGLVFPRPDFVAHRSALGRGNTASTRFHLSTRRSNALMEDGDRTLLRLGYRLGLVLVLKFGPGVLLGQH
jgi:hypothetical protein